MKKALIAMAGLAALGSGMQTGVPSTAFKADPPNRPPAKRRGRNSSQPIGRFRVKRSGTAKYPEQSSRQEMRGHRRAQGGEGIYLVVDKIGISRPRYYSHRPY